MLDMENERTVVKGFYDKEKTNNITPEMQDNECSSSDFSEGEEVNVTWLIYLLAGLGLLSFILSITALAIAC